MKPEPLNEISISAAWAKVMHDTTGPLPLVDFARAIEAARDKQWEAMLAAQPAPQIAVPLTGEIQTMLESKAADEALMRGLLSRMKLCQPGDYESVIGDAIEALRTRLEGVK